MTTLRASSQPLCRARPMAPTWALLLFVCFAAITTITLGYVHWRTSGATVVIRSADGSALPADVVDDAVDWLAGNGAVLRALEVLAESHPLPGPDQVNRLREEIHIEPRMPDDRTGSVRLSYRGSTPLGPLLVHEMATQYVATANGRLADRYRTVANQLHSELGAALQELQQLGWETDRLAPRIQELQGRLRDARIARPLRHDGRRDAPSAGDRATAQQLTQLLETQSHLLRDYAQSVSRTRRWSRELASVEARQHELADLQLVARTESPMGVVPLLVAIAVTAMLGAVVRMGGNPARRIATRPRTPATCSDDVPPALGVPILVFAGKTPAAA